MRSSPEQNNVTKVGWNKDVEEGALAATTSAP